MTNNENYCGKNHQLTWHVVLSVTPQTIRWIPSTHTFNSMARIISSLARRHDLRDYAYEISHRSLCKSKSPHAHVLHPLIWTSAVNFYTENYEERSVKKGMGGKFPIQSNSETWLVSTDPLLQKNINTFSLYNTFRLNFQTQTISGSGFFFSRCLLNFPSSFFVASYKKMCQTCWRGDAHKTVWDDALILYISGQYACVSVCVCVGKK